jgi:hypothetical protein
LPDQTLATMLVGLAVRMAAKVTTCTYTLLVTGCWVVLREDHKRCGHNPDNTHLGTVKGEASLVEWRSSIR